jgi:hypothetical protein
MFEKIFGSSRPAKSVHCEITGNPCTLSETVVLTRIKGVIFLKNIPNADLDERQRIITSGRQQLDYYSEISVPNKLKSVLGRVFSMVGDDPDDIEQTTAVISESGKEIYANQILRSFVNYCDEYTGLHIPDDQFISVIVNKSDSRAKNCVNWGLEYESVGTKYRLKKILEERREKEQFGKIGLLIPGFEVAIGDCCEKNPNGTSYQFKTENKFEKLDLCCNESAVDYCKSHKSLIYYTDFINKGKIRVLSPYTEDINRKLQNNYLFRSSNI